MQCENMIQMIADIFGMFGTIGFLTAELFQLNKTLKIKKIIGLSKKAYINKFIAITLTCICFLLSGLYLSFTFLSLQGIVVGVVIGSMMKYEKEN